MLTLEYRHATTAGEGIGRWLVYCRVEDRCEAALRINSLVPSCLIRLRDNKRNIIWGPMEVREFDALIATECLEGK
jgi:hypothetical protein